MSDAEAHILPFNVLKTPFPPAGPTFTSNATSLLPLGKVQLPTLHPKVVFLARSKP